MNWFLVIYFLALVYLATSDRIILSRTSLKNAWFFLALIPFAEVIFSMIRIGNRRGPSDLMRIELWSNGITWLLLGISLFSLINALFPKTTNAPNRPHEPGQF